MSTCHKILSPHLLSRIDACWRDANYVSVGQIYLYDTRSATGPGRVRFSRRGPGAAAPT